MDSSSLIEPIVRAAAPACPFCKRPLRTSSHRVGSHAFTAPDWGSCGCAESEREYKLLSGKEDTDGEARFRKQCSDAGVGRRYLDTPAPVNVGDYIAAALAGENAVVVGGDCGGLAAHTAIGLLRAGRTVRVGTLSSILQDIKSGYSATDAPSATDRLAGIGALIIHDLGLDVPTGWGLQTFSGLVSTRFANGLPTLAFTRYESRFLIERLGERNLASNIVTTLASGRVFTVEAGGGDGR